MFRYRTTTGISTTLLLMTYGVFGWLYASWVIKIIENKSTLYQLLKPELAVGIFYSIGIVWVLLIAILFSAPVALMAISWDNWLKSDVKALFLIFFGALTFAIIVQRLDYLAKFIILLASAILVKLDLRSMGLNRWLSQLVLAGMCVGSFFGGVIAFHYWG